MKKRTSVLIEESLLRRARGALKTASNTEAIAEALRVAVENAEIAKRTEDLLKRGRGRFIDVYR